MVRFTECFSEQMIPYIQYCIHALFPPNQIALQLGTSVSQLQKEVSINKTNFISCAVSQTICTSLLNL